jgi:sugar/nucleoside kinase (ribokinase family)
MAAPADRYSVFGIGNPLLDFVGRIEESALVALDLRKGNMNLVERQHMEAILGHLSAYSIVPGGSCANTLRTISWLDRGEALEPAVYSGAVGTDLRGRQYARTLEEAGITLRLAGVQLPTGCSVILVTPDHERTMCTYLGACREFTTEHLDFSALGRSRFLYFVGYMWDTANQKRAVQEATEEARRLGLRVCFDLADPWVVDRFCGEFLAWIPGRVDILFGNRDEFRLLFGSELADEALLRRATELSPLVLMKIGSGGCFVADRSGKQLVPPFPAQPVDTTAAGDCFSGGFLFALMRDRPPEAAARLANRAAAGIVTVRGCDFSSLDRGAVLREARF